MNIVGNIKITICFLLSASFLSGCGFDKKTKKDYPYKTIDIFAMDTYMSIKAYGDNADTALSTAYERIIELEKKLSVTDSGSDLWKVNHSEGTQTKVSDDVLAIIRKADEVSKATEGSLNICLYPILKAWGFTTNNYRIPTQSELDALLVKTDFSQISYTSDSVSVPKGYMLDFGALAKGYASDEVIELLRENDIESAIVNLGGNVQTLGKKPDGEQWNVAIRDPFAPDEEMCSIEIGEKAVVTSGSYERCFVGDDGAKYWHILDPENGYPADNGIISMTIIGDSGIECDALSTALFVEGSPDSCDFWRKHKDFEMIFVTDDARIFCTEGIFKSFTNLSEMPVEVIYYA